jgi:hypothetical protein
MIVSSRIYGEAVVHRTKPGANTPTSKGLPLFGSVVGSSPGLTGRLQPRSVVILIIRHERAAPGVDAYGKQRVLPFAWRRLA